MIRDIDWDSVRKKFQLANPFDHAVIDNFFLPEVADKLTEEFPDFNDSTINHYNNPLENKKSLNHWDRFPSTTYRTFNYLGKYPFLGHMQYVTDNDDLELDYGLNGGGWHMHGRGGNLNVHVDYNMHPKLHKQRKLNIIVYLTKNWDPAWGGGLEFWSHDEETNKPKERIITVDNIYNRAVIFDTTQNSWHGLPNPINCPEGVLRKSIAAYYVCPAPAQTENRARALFVPREDQKGDASIEELIKARANVNQSADVYKYKK